MRWSRPQGDWRAADFRAVAHGDDTEERRPTSAGERALADFGVPVFAMLTRGAKRAANHDEHARTHARSEGFAPVWGSEFVTKAATLKGDSA